MMLILLLFRKLGPLHVRLKSGQIVEKLRRLTAYKLIDRGLGHSINQAVLSNVASFITRIKDAGASGHDEL